MPLQLGSKRNVVSPLQLGSRRNEVTTDPPKDVVLVHSLPRKRSDAMTASTAFSSESSLSSGTAQGKEQWVRVVYDDVNKLDDIVATVEKRHVGKIDGRQTQNQGVLVKEVFVGGNEDGTIDGTLLTIDESIVGEEFTLASADDSTLPENSSLARAIRRRTGRDKASQKHISWSTVTKLAFNLDGVRSLARMGKNKTLKQKCTLPASIAKEDIHVHVTMDEPRNQLSGAFQTMMKMACKVAHEDEQRSIRQSILAAVTSDLKSIYSATAENAKVMLCVVIVVASDGSLVQTLTDRNGVMGLAELGLAFRLFDADDLTLFDGGLVVQKKEVTKHILEHNWIENDGLETLLTKLVPKATNDIVSRMGHVNNQLFAEI